MPGRQRGGHGTLCLAWCRGRVGTGTGWYAIPRGSGWILELLKGAVISLERQGP